VPVRKKGKHVRRADQKATRRREKQKKRR